MDIAYLLGATAARLLEPLVAILALILGNKIRSKVTLAIAAVGVAILNTVIFGLIDPAPETLPWFRLLLTGSLASLIWFFGVYSVASYRRRRRSPDVDEGID